jgi:hypothetical protein
VCIDEPLLRELAVAVRTLDAQHELQRA